MQIITKVCNASNFQNGRSTAIKYIVVHYTGNGGDTAKNNVDYFARTPNLKASAHYFVDATEVWQSVKDTDTAWHCGGGRQGTGGGLLLGICSNSNSLGVELCNFKQYNVKVAENAAIFIRGLMAQYDVPFDRIVRHFDVTGKVCPAPLVDERKWAEFKNSIGADALMSKEYEELKAEIAKLKPVIYDYVDNNLPAWAKPTIEKLLKKGILKGDEDGKLGLTPELLRVLVINDRAGVYGA